MAGTPDFLPPILDLRGTWEEILERLYAVFDRDFKRGAVYHRGLRILYNNRILPDGSNKEEGFWHVISKEDRRNEERLIDYRRAERLPWARPTMESLKRTEIRVFDYDHGTKDIGVRHYIWLAEDDYVLILQRKKKALFWITAYYVDSEGRRRDLARRYEKRLQKTATALSGGPRDPSTSIGR